MTSARRDGAPPRHGPPGGRRSVRRSVLATLAAVAVAIPGLVGATTLAAPPAAAATPSDKDVTAVLFQFRWNSVAQACQDSLGPAGYGWVQVSPPNEHVQGHQWWTSYQPVSYRIESKLGTRAEFAAMVATCRAAGVEVIADTVINHMSGKPEGGVGVAGSRFSYYDYPGIYQTQDFHDCRRDIRNYGDRWEVQNCNLVGLADLRTGSDYVRGRIAAYMNDLISLGVRGFRIDAAKHMPAQDVEAIVSRLSDRSVYIVQEVIGAAGEPIRPSEYTGAGDVHEFDYGRHLKRMFTQDRLTHLSTFGQSWGMLPSHQAGVFVDNHDTERNGETLNYTNGAAYTLANVFMLGWPYGSPAVHSGYSFGGNYDAGAPNGGNVTCDSGGWLCQHDWREIRNMVGFRNAVGDAGVTNWWSNGNDAIAFGRGGAGFVVINQESGALNRTFSTSLPAGQYCDVISGQPTAQGCSGRTVTVGGNGTFTADVGSNNALAVHVGARPGDGGDNGGGDNGGGDDGGGDDGGGDDGGGDDGGGDDGGGDDGGVAGLTVGVHATTYWGQDVRIVGNHPALGSWNPAAGARLSADDYPVWRGGVTLPPGTRVEYKYVKVDGGHVVWESGSNRVVTVPASGVLTLDDSWRG